MPVVNGSNFLLVKDTTVIGHSTSVSFDINANLPESTTKNSGGFKEFIVGIKSGNVTCECLTDYSESLQYDDLVDMMITDTKAVFYVKELVDPDLVLRGEGFIANVTETAEFETATTFNVEINLTGVYTISDGQTWENIFRQWQTIADNWNNL
tara:strand:- start:488 stop:946 length:459 start_codon:yes stop_codon:yes gene_type:complete